MHESQAKTGQKHAYVPTLVVSVVFGFAAGVVGMLVAFAYALPSQPLPGGATAVRGVVASPAEEPAPDADLVRSAALFFDKSAIDRIAGPAATASLVPSDAFGSGFALTSDGWLIAHVASFPKGKRPLDSYAVIGGRSYRILQAVNDPFSGIVFLRIDASGLPVAAFGTAEDLLQGGSAFAFDRSSGIRRLGVTAHDDLAVATAAELRWSSEKLQDVVHLSGESGLLPGAMVLSRKGEIVAVYAGADSTGAYAIPLEAFSGIIGGVLKDGVPTRPFLGVRYFDLSRALGTGAPGRGALLVASADGKTPAVARKSPAETAGLLAGDVIVAVNGEEVSAKNALADMIAEYVPGDTVTLTVSRDGNDLRLPVTLGTD